MVFYYRIDTKQTKINEVTDLVSFVKNCNVIPTSTHAKLFKISKLPLRKIEYFCEMWTEADLVLYCYERDFMYDLHECKRHDLIDMFNITYWYLDDIFTIDNPDLRNIFLIYIKQNFS